MDAALKQNIDLKIELSARGQEIKRLKKLLLELEKELERLQRGTGGSRNRERELEEKLQERERELKELRRRQQEGFDYDARNAELEEQLEDVARPGRRPVRKMDRRLSGVGRRALRARSSGRGGLR